MKISNRTGFVLSAIARYHGGAIDRFRDDAGQIAEMACLMHEDTARAVREAIRMFRRTIDYRRPLMISIDGFEFEIHFDMADDDLGERSPVWPLLDRLHPRQREALVRSEIDDVPRDVVAEELGLTGTELGQLIRSARKRLRVLCESEGITP